ncbi:hypothetical protein J6590_106808, partial [Homalodisca vitripennis]
KNVGRCPDLTTLGAVPNLQVDDRYTKPRWSGRLSHRGRGHPQHPIYRVLHLLLDPRIKWGYQLLRIEEAAKQL